MALIARPSIATIQSVFDLYVAREPFVFARSFDAARQLPGISLCGAVNPPKQTGWFAERLRPIDEPGLAQVSFTSGTTGQPKGILLTHAALADVVTRLNTAMALNHEAAEYVGIPPTYSFGLGRFRALAAVGGAAFLPERGFDLREFVDMLRAGDVNALSIVPTIARVMLKQAELFAGIGEKLRWIELGSQYMARAEKEQLKHLFPNARIVQHYGLTEASRSTFLDISATTGNALESVGRPMMGTDLAINHDGRITIRGRHVATQQIENGSLRSLCGRDGWLVTNDRGVIEDGYLYFEGRADDVINCGGVKLVPDQLEDRIRARLATDRGLFIEQGLAVARVPDDLRGDGILVAISEGAPVDPDAARMAAMAELATMGVAPGEALHVVCVRRLPMTETGKVQRGELARQVMADRLLIAPAPQRSPQVAGPPGEADPLEAYGALLARLARRASLPPTASFAAIGGDSLNHVEAAILIEQTLGALPAAWERMTLTELATARSTASHRVAMYEPTRRSLDTNFVQSLRASAIVLVVIAHALGAMLELGDYRFATISRLFYHVNSVFVLVSGFLFAMLLAGFDYRTFLVGKAKTIVAPYLVMSVVPIALYLVGSKKISHLGAPAWVDTPIEETGFMILTGTHLGPFWYVPMICLIYLMTPLLKRLDDKRAYWSIAPLLLIALAVGRPQGDNDPVIAAVFYLPVFIIGMALCRYQRIAFPWLMRTWPALLPGFLLVLLPQSFHLGATPAFLGKLLFALGLIGVLLLVSRSVPRLMLELGELSFGIYFVHGFVIAAIVMVAERGWVPVHGGIAFILLTAVALAGSFTIVRLVKACTGSWSRQIIGA